jgi:hypothetical protein
MPSTPLTLSIKIEGKDSTQGVFSKTRAGRQSISDQLAALLELVREKVAEARAAARFDARAG